MAVFCAVRALALLLQILPRWAGYWLADLVGMATFALWRVVAPDKRQSAVEHARRALGSGAGARDGEAAARRALSNYCRTLVDFLRFPITSSAEIEHLVQVEGWEHLERARAAGHGVVLVGLHMGNWDLGGALLARRCPLSVVVDPFQPAHLDQLIRQIRAEKGMRVIPVGRLAEVVRVLRRNEALALLIDRPCPDGVPVEFLDTTIAVPAGPARLALRTGAAVLPAGMVRQADGTFQARIEPPIAYVPEGNPARDVQRLTQQIMAALENMARRHPDQWYVFRPLCIPPGGQNDLTPRPPSLRGKGELTSCGTPPSLAGKGVGGLGSRPPNATENRSGLQADRLKEGNPAYGTG